MTTETNTQREDGNVTACWVCRRRAVIVPSSSSLNRLFDAWDCINLPHQAELCRRRSANISRRLPTKTNKSPSVRWIPDSTSRRHLSTSGERQYSPGVVPSFLPGRTPAGGRYLARSYDALGDRRGTVTTTNGRHGRATVNWFSDSRLRMDAAGDPR